MTQTIDVTTQPKPKVVKMIQREHPHGYPELWARVFVVGAERQLFPRMLGLARCWQAESVSDADLILFTGGSDISPELYGKQPHRSVYSYPEEDVRDIQVFREAVELGVPMVGVCRGAQFLHVANGGELYQDVDNHQTAHAIWCKKEMKSILASSVHHQMCKYQKSMEVLADATKAKRKWIDDKTCYDTPKQPCSVTDFDIEAFWYPDTACIGFQGHPEYPGYEEYTQWCINAIQDLIIYNPDIGYSGDPARQRLSQEIRDRRGWKEPATFEPFMKEYT